MSLTRTQQDGVVQSLASGSIGVSVVNGAAISCAGYHEAVVILNAGTFTTGTCDVKVQDSADGSTGWADIDGAAFPQVTSANHQKSFLGGLNIERTRGWIRTVTTIATAACPVGVTVILTQPDYTAQVPASSFGV